MSSAEPCPSSKRPRSPADPELTHEEIRRYSRHLILDDVAMQGQRRLKASKVLCVGGGGLGSPALMYLAAAGVGTVGVVDDDVVDESNLQRQIVHATDAVGKPKVESVRERLRDINPHVAVVAHPVRLSAANALTILEPYDLIVDGSDNFPTRYLVNDAAVLLGKPLVYGAVQKFEGQVSLFNYRGGPNYRDLFPQPPPAGAVPSCSEAGVLGVLPGVIGTLQATEAIKVLLGKGVTLSGRLVIYDALMMRFHEVKLSKRSDAPPITGLADYSRLCGGCAEKAAAAAEGGAAAEPFSRLDVHELRSRMAEGWKPFVLDVRTAAEAAIVSFPFVDLQHPHRKIARAASQLPRERDLLVHCRSGVRSVTACEELAKLGFSRLFQLDGGILAWALEIDPTLPTY